MYFSFLTGRLLGSSFLTPWLDEKISRLIAGKSHAPYVAYPCCFSDYFKRLLIYFRRWLWCLFTYSSRITMIDQRNFCFFWAFSEIFCQFLSLMRVACSVCEKSWLMLEWRFTCHSFQGYFSKNILLQIWSTWATYPSFPRWFPIQYTLICVLSLTALTKKASIAKCQ